MKNDKIFSRILGNRGFLIAAICMFILIGTFSQNGFAQSNELILSDKIEEPKGSQQNIVEGDISIISNAFGSELATSSAYTFATTTSGSLTNMTGSTQLVAPSSDDTASAVTNLPFEFYFMGTRYTQFSASSNGFIRLGATGVGTAQYTLGTASVPLISALGSDLETSPSGRVHYVVTGTAPNRVMTVEFLNMTIIYDAALTGVDGTFQARLYENTGVIEFVYGTMNRNASLGFNDANNPLYIGFSTNSTNDNFATVDTANVVTTTGTPVGNVFPLSAPMASLTSATDGSRRTYSFTPPVPAAPSGLNFTGVTGSAITLNWTDNSTNEDLFAIYRSTDGINYSFVGTAAENAVTFADTALVPGTTYFYQVYAVSEGALSTALSGSQATSPAGNDTCNGAGGNWGDTTTWADGTVPTATDNVTIGSGCTVTVNVTTAVAFNVTVDNGGTLQSPLSGAVVNNNLTVSRNVTNNGTLDFSTNGNTSGAILTFGAGIDASTFGGTGATTDVRTVAVAKGAQATVVELTATNFTVQGVNTDAAGFLTLTSGTFKISGSFTMTNRVFTTTGYTIPALGGIWLNNPNFTVAGQNGSPTVTGLLRLTTGTYNVGTASGNSLGGGTGGQYVVEGGVLNVAGRLQSTSTVGYTQSGGTVNVCTVGNTAATACFGLTGTTNTFNLTGGSIVLVLPSTNATPLDYSVSSTSIFTANPAGTTLQIGNGTTPAASTFRVTGNTPNILVSSGQTMNVGTGAAGSAIFFRGSTVTNNGTIGLQGASSRFDFAASGPMTYGGTGTFGTAATSFAGVGISANSPTGNNTTINAPIFVNRVNFFSGGFVNSNQITLGNGGASTTVVQVGNSTTPTNAGSFDVSPVYNSGTGGHIVLHLRSTTLNRTTGFEINPSRTLAQLTYDNDAAGATLTIDGGNLTVTGALALTSGVVVTGANTLIHNGAVTRTTGYVNGNLSRSYTATGAYTYHVGQNGYSPVAATVTALTTNPSSLTVSPVDNTLPGLNPANSVSRFWSLTETGDLTADLAFTYLDADVNGNELDYRVFKLAGGILTNQCPGAPCVNDATNTATVTGISDFSDWGIGEAGAGASGELGFSSATYSVNEDGATATITVNRTGGAGSTVTVDYATAAGGTATGGATCTAGVDFINASGTLTFVNGDTTESFTVTVCDDSTVEGDETVNLALTNPTGGATIGAQNTAVLTIVDVEIPTGNVTVNPGNVSYMTLGEAVAAINAGTHSGAVTVDINASTTETGPVVLNGSGAGAASYTSLIIRPSVDAATISGPTTTGRGLIELNGADNVTIDGDNPNTAGTNRNLTITNTAANTVTFTSVIRIAVNVTTVASADNDVIRNLNINGSATGRNISTATATTGTENNTYGIIASASASAPTTAPTAIASLTLAAGTGATATNLTVSNNNIQTAARGVAIQGSATTVFPGLLVQNNTIGNSAAGDANQVYNHGIIANGTANGVVSGNTIYVEGFVGSSGNSATVGITAGAISANTTVTIEKNKINRVLNENPQTWAVHGINLGGGSNHIVQNNFVSNLRNNQVAGTSAFSTTFGLFGIRVGSGTGHKIYHNSVNLFGVIAGAVNTNLTTAFGIAATGQTGVDVRNNIFVNTLTGGNPTGTRNVAVYLPASATVAMNLTMNNNDYFVGSDANNRLAQVGATFGTGEYTLADFDPSTTTPASNFRAYTSTLSAAGTNDNASKKVDPLFVSNTDLHIQPTSLMESAGANVGVTDDIDGDARSTVPDIGADEITVAGPGVVQFSSTSFSGTEGTTATITVIRTGGTDGTVGVTATVTDGTATGGAACGAGVDFINPGPQTLTFGPGVSSQTFTIQLCTDAVLESVEAVTLTLSNPTGTTIGVNNPATLNIIDVPPPISGTINVGAGETFTSLTNPGGIFQAINNAGLSGNLTVNITSDLTAETGVVVLNQFTETGAGGYTLTFKPSGAPRVISGTAAALSMIKLNGADRVTFDGSLSGGTDRSLSLLYTNTGGTVVWIASADAANGANNNTFKNCIIGANPGTQSVAGVLGGSGTTLGGAAQSPNNNNTIQNNVIFRVQNSIYNQGAVALDQNWTITGNTFGSTVAADKNGFRGMLIGNTQNFVISGNTVNGVTIASTTAGNHASGIQLAFVVNGGTIVNNKISDIRQTGTQGAYGIQLTSASAAANVTIANNFIWDIAAAGSATLVNNGHGIGFNATGSGGYRVYHNSINMNTNQASGTTSALLVGAGVTAAGALDVRNNIFANTQTSGATRFAVHSSAPASVFSAINFNDYFSTGSVGFLGSDRPTLADWQTATGQDQNSLAVDPLFVSATDLHLQAGSPVLNLGTPIAEVTTDIDGDARSATTPDIGADELAAVAQPGTLQFSSPTYTIAESSGTVTLTVTRTDGSDGAVTAQYTLGGGTATGGAACGGAVDYVNTGGTVSFAGGETSKTFDVAICNDSAFEGNETFNATLSNATGGATIGTPNPATVTITDDDPAPGTVTVNDVRVFEGNSGTVNATFTLTYVGPNPSSASVQYATANGTATAGVDYGAASGTVTFGLPPLSVGGNQTVERTVTVVVNGDTLKEANETFFLNLSNPVNAIIADGQGVGIIIDEDRSYVSDFDNDKLSDYTVYRPSTSVWYVLQSTNGIPKITTLGASGDIAVPGDYDGDGIADVAVFRPSEGNWYILQSQGKAMRIANWGLSGDKPVQGDYDGDGKTDLAVFRPSDGTWYIIRSSDSSTSALQFGIGTDVPVTGDFDGDFKNDLNVFRNGTWYNFLSSTGSVSIVNWGIAGDRPLSGDFDGDGKYDYAVYRDGTWWILSSLTGGFSSPNWGISTDIPTPADYDGDGTTDLAVFRPSEGNWYVLRSSDFSFTVIKWGLDGDVPAPAAYTPQP